MAKTTTDNMALVLLDDIGSDSFLPDLQGNWNKVNAADKARQADLVAITRHLVSSGSSPAFAAQAAAGTGASVTLAACTDLAGTLSVVAGTSPSSGVVVTATFATLYGAAPRAVILSASNAAAGLVGAYVSSVSATGFAIGVPNALVSTTTYALSYLVIG